MGSTPAAVGSGRCDARRALGVVFLVVFFPALFRLAGRASACVGWFRQRDGEREGAGLLPNRAGGNATGVVHFQPVSLLLREHRPGQPCRPGSACFPAGGSLPDSSSCCTAQLSHIGFAVTACEMRLVSCYRICLYLSQNHCRFPLTALVGIPANRSSYVGQLSLRRSTRSAMSRGVFPVRLVPLP